MGRGKERERRLTEHVPNLGLDFSEGIHRSLINLKILFVY